MKGTWRSCLVVQRGTEVSRIMTLLNQNFVPSWVAVVLSLNWSSEISLSFTAPTCTAVGVQITPHRTHTRALFFVAHARCDNTFGSRA